MPPQYNQSLAALSPGLVPLVLVQITLPSLMVAHTFLVPLLPLLIALFYYATPHTRHQPIFVLNVLSLTLALGTGTMAEVLGIHALTSPQVVWPEQLSVAVIMIGVIQSLLVDVILLVRLVSVYPLRHVGIRKFVLCAGLPIALKFVRVINVLLCIDALTLVAVHGNALEAWQTSLYVKIEWISQFLDNCYASLVFLYAIRDRGLKDEYSSEDSGPHQRTLTQMLRTLFRIALSNFVIPSVFSVAQLIILFVNPQSRWLIDLPYVNGMLSVYGVVFASVWVGKESRRRAKEAKQSSSSRSSGSRSRTKSFTGLGSFKAATRPTVVSVSVVESVVVDRHPGDSQIPSAFDKGKRPADSDEGHEFALLPLTKQDSDNILPL